MCVEVEVIKMITNGVIPKMSQEERNQLIKDLDNINEYLKEADSCAIEMSKNVADHFAQEDTSALMLAYAATRGG